jgi:hypothetical protein
MSRPHIGADNEHFKHKIQRRANAAPARGITSARVRELDEEVFARQHTTV